jgi:CubicO group peptidase (beta-lactamase class C family)
MRSTRVIFQDKATAGAIAILSLCLAGCATGFPLAGTGFGELGRSLDECLPSAVGGATPAVQVALVEGGRIVYERAFGLADREAGRPASNGDLYQVASISKSVMAWGVLRLAEEGRIDLDAPAQAYVKRWSFPPSRFDAKGVTVRRILSHSAGLSLGGFPGSDPVSRLPSLEESLSGNNQGKGRADPARILKVESEPGKALSYSGGGYTFLQMLVEEVSGEDFAPYMAEHVLRPLDMNSSSFAYTPEVAGKVAGAYSLSGKRLPNYLYTEKAAAGLYSNAHDLAVLLDALYLASRQGAAAEGPGILDGAHAALFAEPQKRLDATTFVGLGYFISKPRGGSTVLFHSGSNRGWRAWYGVELETGRGIVVLANSDAGSGLVGSLSEAYLGSLGR